MSLILDMTSYVSRTTAGTPTNDKKWTLSLWFQQTLPALGVGQVMVTGGSGGTYEFVELRADQDIRFSITGGAYAVVSSQTITDTNWHHILVAFDSAQATAADRIKMYLDGVAVTINGGLTTYPAQNTVSPFNSSGKDITLGTFDGDNSVRGSLAQVRFVDGQALTPSSFTSGTGAGTVYDTGYSGSFGNNGFYISFDDPTSTTTVLRDEGTGLKRSAAGANDFTDTDLVSAKYHSYGEPPWYSVNRLKCLNFLYTSSQYLSRTFVLGNRQKFTFSTWVDMNNDYYDYRHILFSQRWTTPGLEIELVNDGSIGIFSTGDGDIYVVTDVQQISNSGWCHLMVSIDTTQATLANRVRVYVNGYETTYSTYTCTQNYNTGLNTANPHNIGRAHDIGNYISMRLADTWFVDGTQLIPTDLINTVGNFIYAKKYIGSLGTNGFRLTYNNATSTTTLGYDDGTGAIGSGAGSNDWTLNAMSTSDSSITGVGYIPETSVSFFPHSIPFA